MFSFPENLPLIYVNCEVLRSKIRQCLSLRDFKKYKRLWSILQKPLSGR